MPDNDDRNREQGWVVATLDGIVIRLVRIEKKLDDFNTWQREVDSRLATGSEKFHQLEGRDRQAGWIGSIVGVISATISTVIMELRR